MNTRRDGLLRVLTADRAHAEATHVRPSEGLRSVGTRASRTPLCEGPGYVTRRAIIGLVGGVVAAGCGAAALLGFGIVGDSTPARELPRNPAPAATLRPTGREDFTEVSTSTLHYVDLLAEDDRLTLRAIDQTGMLFDSVELSH